MSYRFTKLNAQHVTQIKLQKPHELDIYRSEVSDHIFSLLQDALSQIPLVSLDIGATDLGDSSLRSLFEQFSIRQLAPRGLRSLALSRLCLRGSVRQLANYVRQFHCELEELDVHDCELGNDGLSVLTEAFREHFEHSATLKQVNLRKNQIQTVAAVALRKMIEAGQIFCNFDLELNEINENVLEWFEQPRRAGVGRITQRVRQIADGEMKSEPNDALALEFERFKHTIRGEVEKAASQPRELPPRQSTFRAERFYEPPTEPNTSEMNSKQRYDISQARNSIFPDSIEEIEQEAVREAIYSDNLSETQDAPTDTQLKAAATRLGTSEFDQYYLKTRELSIEGNRQPMHAELTRIPDFKPTEPTFFTDGAEEMPPLTIEPIEKPSAFEDTFENNKTPRNEDYDSTEPLIAKTTPINIKKNIFKATARASQEDAVSTQYIQRSQGIRIRAATDQAQEPREKRATKQQVAPECRIAETESTERRSAEREEEHERPEEFLLEKNGLVAEQQNTAKEVEEAQLQLTTQYAAELSFSQMEQASFSPSASEGAAECPAAETSQVDLCELLGELDNVPELYFKLKEPRELSYLRERLHQLRESHEELVQSAEGAQIVLETYNEIYEELIRQGLLFGEVRQPTGVCAIQDYVSTIGVEMYKLILNLIKQQAEYDLDGQQE